jgi:hypothetical protein
MTENWAAALPMVEDPRLSIIDFASNDERATLSDEQVAEVARRIADPNRKFISTTELRKRLRHFGV